jgi:hypothetical protein
LVSSPWSKVDTCDDSWSRYKLIHHLWRNFERAVYPKTAHNFLPVKFFKVAEHEEAWLGKWFYDPSIWCCTFLKNFDEIWYLRFRLRIDTRITFWSLSIHFNLHLARSLSRVSTGLSIMVQNLLHGTINNIHSILIVTYVPFCVFCVLLVCKCVLDYCHRDIGALFDYPNWGFSVLFPQL